MTIEEYQRQAARTINWELCDKDNQMHALHGMASEVGEIHGLYQKVYQGHKIDTEHLKLEVGDLLWFIAEFCTANGWSMADMCEKNIRKLRNRYPRGFDSEHSLHRRKGDV